MVLRYGVLKDGIPNNSVDDYCIHFYKPSTDQPAEERMAIFSTLDDAMLYAEDERRIANDQHANVEYPIYQIEFEDRDDEQYNTRFRDRVFVNGYNSPSNKRPSIERRIVTEKDLHEMPRVTCIYRPGIDETKLYRSGPYNDWISARYRMLEDRLNRFSEENTGIVVAVDKNKAKIAVLIQDLLNECKQIKNKGTATTEQIANALFLVDDAVNGRLSHAQFIKRKNELPGRVEPSPGMLKIGILLGLIGLVLVTSGALVLSAGVAAAGVGFFAIGVGLCYQGAARHTGLCKLADTFDIDDAPYF